MSESPWTSDDPQPGDFDAELDLIAPDDLVRLPPNPDARVSFLVKVDREDFDRLGRLAATRGETPDEVLSDLLREAERSTA